MRCPMMDSIGHLYYIPKDALIKEKIYNMGLKMDKEREIEIENRLTDVERRNKVSEKRIDKLENQYELIMDMNSNIKVLVEQNGTQSKAIETQTQAIANVESNLNTFKTEVKQDMSSLKKDIDEVKIQPDKKSAETFNKIKWEIVRYIVIAITALLIGKFGL